MLSEQLLIAHKDILDKNICSEKEIEDIIGFIESFKGIYLYPRVLRRKFNIDMAKAYEILNELVRIGVLRLAFEIYCSDCDKFQNAVYDSLNEIPKNITCEYCGHDIDFNKDIIVIYKVNRNE